MDKLDLLDAFRSYNSCGSLLTKLSVTLNDADPAVAVLALEGLYRVESDVKGGQFLGSDDGDIEKFQTFLRNWRRESPIPYEGAAGRVRPFLQNLTIFKTLQIPLFIDDYGKKELLSSYNEGIEDIAIDENTPISHVTHREEAKKICEENQIKPSDNKNIIKGCWFGFDNTSSVYGTRSFKTTLSQLGVTGLRQGEIVSYKNEINVILYAADGTNFTDLKKPTDGAVKKTNPEAYVKVSIFVPSRFLPSIEDFWGVFSKPTEVTHGPFCVRVRRSRTHSHCNELVK